MKITSIVVAMALLSGCSIYSKLDYEVRPSTHAGGVTLVCKEASSGTCQFVVAAADDGGNAAARYDVPSGGRKEIDGLHPGTKVCAVVRPGAACSPRDVAVGR